MKYISAHISWAEAIRSDAAKRAGIINRFTPTQLKRMTVLAEKVFEPLRNHFKTPIFIASFFRNAALNKLLGGALTSQHLANKGAAIDIDNDVFGTVSNRQIFLYIKDNLEFDQLIWEDGNNVEPGWVHVSYNEGKNRKQVLRMIYKKGVKSYIPYIHT